MKSYISRPCFRHIVRPAALMLFGLTTALSVTGASAQDRPDVAASVFYVTTATISAPVSGNALIGYANEDDHKARAHAVSPTVTLAKGGSFDLLLTVCNSSKFIITGGTITGSLFPQDNSAVTLNSGSIDTLLGVTASGSSKFSVTGGTISGSVTALDSSAVTISGGTIANDLSASNKSMVNLKGGSVGGDMQVDDSGTLNLYGMNLSKTLKDGDVTLTGRKLHYSQYKLSGKLADGTSVNDKTVSVENGGKAKLTLNAAK